MREQIAQQYPLRATRHSPDEASRHRAGHYAGMHPEDRPRWTGDPRRQHYQDAPTRRHHADTDEVEEDDSIYDPPSHTSVRRYAPAPPQTQIRVTHHRASAQTYRSTEEPTTRRQLAPQPRRLHWLVPLGVGMLVMVALWIVGNMALSWWQTLQNDWHYGRPRTYQTDVRVDTPDLSHFIALNLGGRIEIVEFPGGDATKARVYIGPTLAAGHDLDPVTLQFRDVNGDGKPDMIIMVGETRQIFINDNGSFRPMRPGEKVSL